MPRAELHVHVEGTLQPDLAFSLAQRNGITLQYATKEELRKAYRFESLQSFLDVYYEMCAVLVREEDFQDLLWAALVECKRNNVVHVEVFFDPQSHVCRGVEFATFMRGFQRAQQDALDKLNVSCSLIMCFLRHLSEEDGFRTLDMAKPFLGQIVGVGLDSGERGNPPSKFQRLFARCRDELHLHVVAHAGEEGPPEFVEEALDVLKAERIDHGVRSAESPALLQRLARDRVGLTVCPLSNLKLCVFASMEEHTLPRLLEAGIPVSVNSDDPGFFGGGCVENFQQLFAAFPRVLGVREAFLLARNSFETSFADPAQKAKWVGDLEDFFGGFVGAAAAAQ